MSRIAGYLSREDALAAYEDFAGIPHNIQTADYSRTEGRWARISIQHVEGDNGKIEAVVKFIGISILDVDLFDETSQALACHKEHVERFGEEQTKHSTIRILLPCLEDGRLVKWE